MRHLLTDQFPRQVEQVIWDKGLIDSRNRIDVEQSLKNVIATVVLPCFCETGAYYGSFMLKNRKLSTLLERRELFSAVTKAWNPDDVSGVAE